MQNLSQIIATIKQEFTATLATITNETALESVRVAFLGRKGKIADLMEQLFDASIQRRSDELALGDSAPFTGSSDGARVRRESDQSRIVAVFFTHQLSQRDLPVGAHLGGSRVTHMRVMRPHDDSSGLGSTLPVQVG